MTEHTKNPHAVALGKLGGQARAAQWTTPEERHAAASRAGKHAPGWPKGKPRGPSPLKGRKRTPKPQEQAS